MKMNVHYNSEGYILIEFAGQGLELDRREAEQLFVDLGYVLQDMDMVKYTNENDGGEQP